MMTEVFKDNFKRQLIVFSHPLQMEQSLVLQDKVQNPYTIRIILSDDELGF